MNELPQKVSGVSPLNDAIDGTVTRRGRGPGRRLPLDYHIQVDPRVVAEAARVVRPNERFVIVDETTMRSVYITEKRGIQ